MRLLFVSVVIRLLVRLSREKPIVQNDAMRMKPVRTLCRLQKLTVYDKTAKPMKQNAETSVKSMKQSNFQRIELSEELMKLCAHVSDVNKTTKVKTKTNEPAM